MHPPLFRHLKRVRHQIVHKTNFRRIYRSIPLRNARNYPENMGNKHPLTTLMGTKSWVVRAMAPRPVKQPMPRYTTGNKPDEPPQGQSGPITQVKANQAGNNFPNDFHNKCSLMAAQKYDLIRRTSLNCLPIKRNTPRIVPNPLPGRMRPDLPPNPTDKTPYLMEKEKKKNHFIQKPKYAGGPKALTEFIYSNLKYPESARAAGVEGTVLVEYDIDHTGKVSDVRVIQGIGSGCDEEACRVVRMLQFEATKNRGLKVWFHQKARIVFKKPLPPPSLQIQYTISKDNHVPQKTTNPTINYTYTIKTKS